jgi:predicted ribosome quality control (RQC) complex YloA/Tae2 family protein
MRGCAWGVFPFGFGFYVDWRDIEDLWLFGRRFYTRREKIEYLKRLKEKLERELQGIEERIRDLEAQEAASR